MSYTNNIINRQRAQRVTLLVFRQARTGDHELLVGRSVENPSAPFVLPIRAVETEDHRPPQREEHAVRCLSEVTLRVDINASQADIRRTVGMTHDNGLDRVRAFPVRTTAEFDAAARDGRARLGHVYEFVPLSVLSAQEECLVPDMDIDNSAVKEFLDDYIIRIEADINALTPPSNYD